MLLSQKNPQDMLAEYVSISCTQTEHIIVVITVKDPQDMIAEYFSISYTQTGHIIVAITEKSSGYACRICQHFLHTNWT